ncbi:MAG: WYL domain-containing protein [Xanthomonadales bacterium]|jgi:predicted DNA-binding transcriptional regulator YafY|nr:WYL domain-containing protein [Xanthomonadales bacterium]
MALQTLLRVLSALDTREARSVSELMRRLAADGDHKPVTRRTVERTLSTLDATPEKPVVCVESNPQRWRLRGNSGLVQSLVNEEQRLQQQLMARMMRQLLPPRLADRLPDPQPLTAAATRADWWLSRVLALPPGIPRYPQPLAEGVLEAVGRALWESRQLDLQYRSRGQRQSRRLSVHPQGLVQDGYRLTLVAVVEGYSDLRQFLLSRVERAEVRAEPLHAVPGFDLAAYAQRDLDWPLGQPMPHRFRIHRDRVIELEELPIAEDQRIAAQPDAEGFHEVQATLTPSMRLEAFFLSYGDQLRRESSGG